MAMRCLLADCFCKVMHVLVKQIMNNKQHSSLSLNDSAAVATGEECITAILRNFKYFTPLTVLNKPNDTYCIQVWQ